jgi:hypothetical protein
VLSQRVSHLCPSLLPLLGCARYTTCSALNSKIDHQYMCRLFRPPASEHVKGKLDLQRRRIPCYLPGTTLQHQRQLMWSCRSGSSLLAPFALPCSTTGF